MLRLEDALTPGAGRDSVETRTEATDAEVVRLRRQLAIANEQLLAKKRRKSTAATVNKRQAPWRTAEKAAFVAQYAIMAADCGSHGRLPDGRDPMYGCATAAAREMARELRGESASIATSSPKTYARARSRDARRALHLGSVKGSV